MNWKDIREQALHGLRGLLNPTLIPMLNVRRCSAQDALVISGYPRSGTTWLAEVIASVPGSAILFEPLNLQAVPGAREAGFDWDNFHLPGEEWPAGERFMEAVLSGKVLNRWTTGYIPLGQTAHIERWIVKFVRANQMLGWITQKFSLRAPVFIVRHPCAVFSSWSERGWPMLPRAQRNPAFLRAYPQLEAVMDRLETPEEFFAAKWCMENYAPLALPKPRGFHVVAYEQLRTAPREELEPIFADWNLEIPAGIEDLIRRPSAKASAAFLGQGGAESGGWSRRLKPAQIDAILAVVAAFGLDFYDGSPVPDMARLAAFDGRTP